jgi:hypothetical protein
VAGLSGVEDLNVANKKKNKPPSLIDYVSGVPSTYINPATLMVLHLGIDVM